MSKVMNHVIELNGQKYIVRQAHQKLLLLTFPQLQLIHKYYTNANFTYLNSQTHQILVVSQNQITILKPVVSPLQLVCQQQSFVDWQPLGGILLQQHVVLFGAHGIVFYTRSNIMQKTWQIEVLQDIEELKCSSSQQVLVMKVKQVQKSLFIWKLAQPSSKPAQEITLTNPILQFDFLNQDTLVILTTAQLRIYVQTHAQFNLFHFFLVNANCFASLLSPTSPNVHSQISVNTIVLLNQGSNATLMQLYGLEKRLLKSESKQIGSFRLQCDSINMKKLIAAWGLTGKIGLVCEGKNRELFIFEIDRELNMKQSKGFEKQLGSQIEDVYVDKDTALVKDSKSWKYYLISSKDNFKLLDEVNCQKAFLWSQKRFLYISEQALYIKEVGGQKSQAISFKYSNKDKAYSLNATEDTFFLVSGIKFYRLEKGVLSLAGFALKNERAQLIQVNIFASTLTYQLAQQYILFSYKVVGQKVVVKTLKSSSKTLIPIKGDYWGQKQQLQFTLGSGQRILAVFSIAKLLKILDSQNKIYNYTIYSLNDGGFVILIKNYIFFLQLVEQERGCQIVLIKRANSLLYHRFNPHCSPIKLVDPNRHIFWVGNTLVYVKDRINPHSMADPYNPPETLLRKQLQLKKCYPPQHPRLLQLLIETGKFNLALQILKKVRIWFKHGQPINSLYQSITIQFVTDALWTEKQEDISRWTEQVTNQQAQLLHTFSQQIIENIEGLKLRQKTPLLFQSLIRSFCGYLRKNKMVDYFSQSVLITVKSGISKGKGLSSMSIAYLAHSLNKEQAAVEIKPEKVSWQWLKQFSIPLWYDGKEQLKKWIQQMAAHQYRQTKDPLNCLLWYLIVGKRALLTTLFKNHKLDSKEHQAIGDFLARDFNQPKDRSAAIKNAYVLIDKKRYYHALSFFILGGAIDECVRLAVDRLKDLNLGYLFILMFKQASLNYFTQVMLKGDIWMRHLVYRISGKHILSYNCLFQEIIPSQWGYQPELTGFHPALLDFALKIRNSISVKRQIEQQRRQQNQSQDIFADFYGSSSQTIQTQQQIVQLVGDIDQLKPNAIKYYLNEGIPLLALALQESNQQAKQAHYLELYQIGAIVKPELQSIVIGLLDKLAAFQCLVANKKLQKAALYLKEMIESLKESLEELQFVEVISTKKHLVGQILHFTYFSEKIIQFYSTRKQKQVNEEIENTLQQLLRSCKISKVISCLLLDCYEQMVQSLQQLGQNKIVISNPSFWVKLKESYDSLIETKKLKQLQQMDHFEHVFVSSYRPNQSQNIYRPQLSLTQQQAAQAVLKLCVMKHLSKQSVILAQLLLKKTQVIQSFLDYWVIPFKKIDLLLQFKVLLKQGTQSKLKLNILGKYYGDFFNQIYDIIALTHNNYFDKIASVTSDQKNQDLQAIQVYRNKAEGIKTFAINIHSTKGIQSVVILKKNIKKFELCANLTKKERSKDGFSLLADDNGTFQVWNGELEGKGKQSTSVQETLAYILSQKNDKKQEQFPKKYINYTKKEQVKKMELPGTESLQSLNCIDCHPLLPLLLAGGKGQIELINFSNLKAQDRIKCANMLDIVKIHSSCQRVGAMDLATLNLYHLESAYHSKCLYSLKRNNLLDFCFLSPSQLGVISNSSVQIVDTLLHPNRQSKFKQNLSKEPLSICRISDNKMAVLRKGDVLIYDLRMQRMSESKELKSKGKSILVEGNLLYVGKTQAKVRVLNLKDLNDACEPIKVGGIDQREREKISIDQMLNYQSIVLALTNEGSIFCLPKISTT